MMFSLLRHDGYRPSLLALAFLLMAGTVSAQDRPRHMKLPLTVLALAGATDVVSTFTSHANTENNPVVSWMNPHAGLPTTVAVGAAIEVAAIWSLCKLLCENHPKLATTLAYVGAGVHGSMAAKNWHNRGRHARAKVARLERP